VKQIIGFAEKYYTLWSFDDDMTEGYYVKNLSVSLEIAKSKVEYDDIDLDLRGMSWSSHPTQNIEAKADEFSFGMKIGNKILESSDVWQLERATKEETSDRQELAVERLMELGDYDFVPFRKGYWQRTERNQILAEEKEEKRRANLKTGHFYEAGQKVELELSLLDRFSFESVYGWCSVRVYESKDGCIFKYMGNRPTLELDSDGFHKVVATIKHSEYKGIKETKIIRIKTKGETK